MSPLGDARVLCCAANPCFPANPKPRAWLRHTPYLNGGGRLKTCFWFFRRPVVSAAGLLHEQGGFAFAVFGAHAHAAASAAGYGEDDAVVFAEVDGEGGVAVFGVLDGAAVGGAVGGVPAQVVGFAGFDGSGKRRGIRCRSRGGRGGKGRIVVR